MPSLSDLLAHDCRQRPALLLSADEIDQIERLLPQWRVIGPSLLRRFEFTDFHQTMAFVNAVAAIAHREDHHPDLQVSYAACQVSYTTHSAGGLTQNDLACAAKIGALVNGDLT